MEAWQLSQRQGLPLEVKIEMSKLRIRKWYESWDGDVYVSFSGGKDSTVLLHLVRELYPKVPAVFVDTGLEYPEIRAFVKSQNNVVWLKPSMQFREVIKTCGYPLISKDVSRILRYSRSGSEWAKNKLLGINNDGTHSEFKQRYLKYSFLQDAPFNISDACCELMKEKPLRDFGKTSGLKTFVGLMAEDSMRRKQAYMITGCNAFDIKTPASKPMGFWLEQDVLQYIKEFNLPYSKVYGEILQTEKGLITTGEHRTGCMFCMFGAHLEKGENRFQRMERTHPKQWKYCIKGGRWKNGRWVPYKGLGLGYVLRTIGVDYRSNSLFA